MLLARIVGNMVSSCAHPSLSGNVVFLCQPVDENGNDCGEIVAAVSPFGGAVGMKVVVVADGRVAQSYVGDKKSPLRHCVICVLD